MIAAPIWNIFMAVALQRFLRSTLAIPILATTLGFVASSGCAATFAKQEISRAVDLYSQGKATTATKVLADLTTNSTQLDSRERLLALDTLTDICLHNYAYACVLKYGEQYYDTAKSIEPNNRFLQRIYALRYLYFVDFVRYAAGVNPDIITDNSKKLLYSSENTYIYLQREMFLAQEFALADKFTESEQKIDRVMSVIASIKNPAADRFGIACALNNAISNLMFIGDTERAYGIYKVAGNFIARNLSEHTLDYAIFRYNEANLLEILGDFPDSVRALDSGIRTLRSIELDPLVRDDFLAIALNLKAADCATLGKVDCAHDAISQHPYTKLYAVAGRKAASYNEVIYLAARALVGAQGGHDDSVVVDALKAPAPVSPYNATTRQERIYRAIGMALALPPGHIKDAAFVEAGRLEVDAARTRPIPGFGAWYRPPAIDQLVIGFALRWIGRDGPNADEDAFALLQLDGRRGASFDDDALTVLAQAQNETARRSLHQALRLRARRDRVEREQLETALQPADSSVPSGILQYDFKKRIMFRNFNNAIGWYADPVNRGSMVSSASNIVSLKDFQAKLQPNEAALYVTASPGGAAYMCVRRESTMRNTAPANWSQFQLDSRIVQNALAANYRPSNDLDTQFPVEASRRLYDFLIRPFDGCLKPGDHIIWLPKLSMTPVPLSVLLDRSPPKLGNGYDLAAADWLVLHHAVTYAGAASVISAARSSSQHPADFDFLGVGNPLLSGTTPTGEDRTAILARGTHIDAALAQLAPLPDTEVELEESARGFKEVKLLTQADATERNLRQQLLGSYSYLSFATHGLVREEVQALFDPALVLTPVSAKDPSDDGLLTASAIADLNLSARFVVLSACNTATFDASKMPEDLPALSSAFAIAGVPATLATLWSVNSESTTRIVSETFADLRSQSGVGPAQALAAAQRRFLTSPPRRAYLHPRFWAAFVVIGDGGPVPAEGNRIGRVRVKSVESLTADGGEVLGTGRIGNDFFERFTSDRNTKGRFGSGIRVSTDVGRQIWRHDNWDTGASSFATKLGSRVVAGGYQTGANGHNVPVLETFDARSGKQDVIWRGSAPTGMDSFLVAGTKLGPKSAVFAVVDKNFDAHNLDRSSHAHVYKIDDKLDPHLIFDVNIPKDVDIWDLTLSPFGQNILVTFDERFPSNGLQPYPEDTYDWESCPVPTTWLEIRDPKTGYLKSASTLSGTVVTNATPREANILIAGAVEDRGNKSTCGETRAAIFEIDRTLSIKSIFADKYIGASEIRAIGIMADGKMVAVGYKDNVVDYYATFKRGGLSQLEMKKAPSEERFSGMLLLFTKTNVLRNTTMLDAGYDVRINTLTSGGRENWIAGGTVGDRAVIFHAAVN